MGTSVKIMLSYDYCHFEICKGTDQELSNKEVNELRKDVQRLANEAVRQYKVAKEKAAQWADESAKFFYDAARRVPLEARTPEQKAIIKQYEDDGWRSQFDYDYEDDEIDF
jgi:hypothetical protein